MTVEELKTFYQNTYTKVELAELLAGFASSGQLPHIPTSLPKAQPNRGPGRPSQEDTAARIAMLHTAITGHYPAQVDISFLASLVGLARSTVVNLQDDNIFLHSLGGTLGTYFSQLPKLSHSRLTPTWRAVLDLHNYRMLHWHNYVRLPLYRSHTLLWGRVANLDEQVLQSRDSAERARVMSPQFNAILDQVGWPLVEPCIAAPADGGYMCQKICPVVSAYLDSVDVSRLEIARKVTGKLSWIETERQFIDASTAFQATLQIVGLE